MPMTPSATGHAFAAFLLENMAKALIAEELCQYREGDEDAATQRERFLQEPEEARQRGISQAARPQPSPFGECLQHECNGHMVMALSATSPASRLSADCKGRTPTTLKAAAEQLRIGRMPQGQQ